MVLNQLLYDESLRGCMDRGESGVILNLSWKGNSPPKMQAFKPGRMKDQRVDECLRNSMDRSVIRWITPGSGVHETQIAWHMLWVE